MSGHTKGPKTWLLAYDIADPKRLRRVHRLVRRNGASVQYSAYSLRASEAALEPFLDELRCLIAPAEDDVRAYHVPARCKLWTLGRQGLPDGVEVDAQLALDLLLERSPSPEPAPKAGGQPMGANALSPSE
jgi:CRISPR-associated protein Cas2